MVIKPLLEGIPRHTDVNFRLRIAGYNFCFINYAFCLAFVLTQSCDLNLSNNNKNYIYIYICIYKYSNFVATVHHCTMADYVVVY